MPSSGLLYWRRLTNCLRSISLKTYRPTPGCGRTRLFPTKDLILNFTSRIFRKIFSKRPSAARMG
ncbi:MAG: hypothetical protein DMG18_03810, partial [Acidobacteria bacterium]